MSRADGCKNGCHEVHIGQDCFGQPLTDTTEKMGHKQNIGSSMAEVVCPDGQFFLLIDGLVCARASAALDGAELMNIRDRINAAHALKMQGVKAAGDVLADIAESHAMQTYDRMGTTRKAIEAWRRCAP